MVTVAVVGLVIWHRDRRLWLFAGLGAVAAALSLAPGHGYWVPWQAIDGLPWVGDVVEARFSVVTILCAAVMVALVVDHARAAAAQRWPDIPWPRRAVAAGLCLVAIVPSLVVLWPNVPLTVRPVELPAWFTEVGADLPSGNVVLVYPTPSSGLQSSEAWQAVNRMQWAQASGGGPTGEPKRAGVERPGAAVLDGAALALGAAPLPTPGNLRAIRRALLAWGVTVIVVPDQGGLPRYERGRSTAYAIGLITAAVGRPPTASHGAWVWDSTPIVGPPAAVGLATFARCTGAADSSVDLGRVPACILGRDLGI